VAQENRIAARVFNLAIVALLGYLLFRIFQPFVGPILWAFLIAFLLYPVNDRLRKAVRGRKGVAAILLTLAVTLGIVAPATIGAVAFARQAVDLGRALAQRASAYQVGGVQDIQRLPLIGPAMEWLQKHFAVDAAEVQDWAVHAAQNIVQFLLTHTRDVLLGALGFVGNLILMLFLLFFFFRDGDAMARRLKALVPMDPGRKDRLGKRLGDVTRAVVFGSVATAILQGITVGLAFAVTRLPSPVVFGALAAIASFIPVGGTAFVWGPAALYLLSQGASGRAIFMAAWGALVVGMVDNFVRPLLVSGRAALGTLTVFFGVLGGLAAFGMIGLFLGPVILALVLALIQFAEETPHPRP
jgi:predicted PurR-regulated permease PerM